MPVFNAEKYLSESVESILAQTFTDFEFICVDDGSTDGSLELLETYAQRDERIQIIRNNRIKGEAGARNTGIGTAQGLYIAGQDADDISLPSRLERQVAYMQVSPDVGVLGSGMLVIDASGHPIRNWTVFEDDIVLRCLCLVSDPIPHPSVMVRKDIIDMLGGYREDLIVATDYEAWVRAASICKLSNLSETLIYYRIYPGQLSAQRNLMRSNKIGIQRTALETLAGEMNFSSIEILRMGDLAAGSWQELSPEDVLTTAEMVWSIMRRCIAKWGGGLEEEEVIRLWLAHRVMRVAGSMLRGGKKNVVRQCLPFALQIAPEYKWSREDIWLRGQAVLGPWGAHNLTRIVRRLAKNQLIV